MKPLKIVNHDVVIRSMENRFKVEQQLEDGTFEHCMGDHELRWNVKYSKIE